MPVPVPVPGPVPAAGSGSGSQGSGWGTLIVAGAARGWMIFAIVWGSLLFLDNALRH